MQTIVAFIEFVLGFAPIVIIVLAITTALWAATKLFPNLGEWMDEAFDRLFGVDAEYDEKHNTDHASNTFDQYV